MLSTGRCTAVADSEVQSTGGLELTGDDFEALVHNSEDVIALINRDTRLIYANPAAERLLGLSVGGDLGQLMSERVHPDDAALALSRLTAITSGGPSGIPIAVRVRDTRGSWKVLEVVGSDRLDDPRVSGIVLNARDVTDREHLRQTVEHSLEQTIQTVATMFEVRDRYTSGHQSRVARLAEALARKLNLDAQTTRGIAIAASLHDIGKIAVPSEILTKPGRLSDPEMAVIRAHPQVGHDILRHIDFPWPVTRMILEHHERDDGSGYPNRRTSDELLLGSRILAVADVMEAMSNDRPYRSRHGHAGALEELTSGAGRLYDATVVQACVDLFGADGFTFDPSTTVRESSEQADARR